MEKPLPVVPGANFDNTTSPEKISKLKQQEGGPPLPTLGGNHSTLVGTNSYTTSKSPTIWNSLWSYILGGNTTRQNNGGPPNKHRKTHFSTTIPQRPQVELDSTTYVRNVVLALWDNISGPRLEQVWGGQTKFSNNLNINNNINNDIGGSDNSTNEPKEEDLLYAARYTLGGEIVSESTHMETKFQVVPDRGYFSHSRLFHATYHGQSTLFALSLIFSLDTLPNYLRLHHVVNDRVQHLVNMYVYLLKKRPPDSALDVFSSQVPNFIKDLDAIFDTKLAPVIFEKTMFAGTPLGDDLEFLAKAVTSHLQTHGSTVVIGTAEQQINSYMETLSLFLSCDEKKRSSTRVVPGRGYVPDLLLQGIIGAKIPDESIILSMLPTTLVDLQTMTVKQTHPYHEYTVLRKEYMKLRNTKLVSSSARKENLWTAQEGLFRLVKQSAPCISRILNDVFRLPMHLREGFIAHSMKLLSRKAVVLIKYVEALLSQPEEGVRSEVLDPGIIKKIRQDLDLSDQCFTVLLGIAEKMSPGIYITLVGDPGKIEEKFIELFESF